MIVTVWWEDERKSVQSKLYGPHTILAACVADELGLSPGDVLRRFVSVPKKGAGKLLRALATDARQLQLGPLCAVLDRDHVLDHVALEHRTASCTSGMRDAIRAHVDGPYYLVLLTDNMESLVEEAARALGRSEQLRKRPTVRDDVLQALAFHHDPAKRAAVRAAVDGFDRLVRWTAGQLDGLRSASR